jgi:microcystin-dependent protein
MNPAAIVRKKSDMNIIKKIFSIAFTTTVITAAACPTGDNAYIGSVCIALGKFCPNGTALASGQPMAVSQYPALYAVIRNTYGGDGKIFNMPNLMGRDMVSSFSASDMPPFASTPLKIGTQQGFETVTLNAPNIPATGALLVGVAAGSGAPGAASNLSATAPVPGGKTPVQLKIYTQPSGSSKTTPISGPQPFPGNSKPFTVIPPQLAVSVCIVTEGVFPENTNN